MDCSGLKGLRAVYLRLRHPARAAVRSVRVNGRRSRAWDARSEAVVLRAPKGKLAVTVLFARMKP